MSQARMVGGERISLAPVDPRVEVVPPHVKKDPAQVPLTVKKTLLDEYNGIMWSVPAIQSSSISYVDRNRTVYFANSEGSYIEQGKVDVAIRLSAMARDGADVQQAGVSLGSNGDFSFVEELHQDARDVADKAVRLLKGASDQGRGAHRDSGPGPGRSVHPRGLWTPFGGGPGVRQRPDEGHHGAGQWVRRAASQRRGRRGSRWPEGKLQVRRRGRPFHPHRPDTRGRFWLAGSTPGRRLPRWESLLRETPVP